MEAPEDLLDGTSDAECRVAVGLLAAQGGVEESGAIVRRRPRSSAGREEDGRQGSGTVMTLGHSGFETLDPEAGLIPGDGLIGQNHICCSRSLGLGFWEET
jgi:hypothetical protein